MPPPIRYRKGELIGCGAFGHVYMGMNLDSGELLAIKQVTFHLILSEFLFILSFQWVSRNGFWLVFLF
jgi:serine/threonine protein kinase